MKFTTEVLSKLTTKELESLNDKVITMLRQRIAIDSYRAINDLKVGMVVTYTGAGGLHGTKFTIEKINKVNVVCKSPDGDRWNIKASSLVIDG